METLTTHVTELLNSNWLVPKHLEPALGEYILSLQKEPEPKTIEKLGLGKDRWLDDEDDDSTLQLTEGDSIWIIDIESYMWRSSSRKYGASFYADTLERAYKDPQCKGVILRLGNGMGGERKASYMLADTISRRNKPVSAYIEYGCAYSGHYLVVCSCDLIICSNPTDSVGGIGAYISYVDYSSEEAKWGVVRKDIYANSSPDKNKATREAKKGNFKLLEEQAETIALQFQERVIKARGAKLTSDVPLDGGEFDASEALSLGLIDFIAPFEGAMKKTIKLANQSFSNQTNIDMFGYLNAPKLKALKGVLAADITEDQLNEALTELQNANLSGFVELLQSLAKDNTTTPPPIDVKLSAEYKALEAQLTTANTSVQTLTTELAGYKQPGGEPTRLSKKAEKIEDTGSEEEDQFLSEADIKYRQLLKQQKPN